MREYYFIAKILRIFDVLPSLIIHETSVFVILSFFLYFILFSNFLLKLSMSSFHFQSLVHQYLWPKLVFYFRSQVTDFGELMNDDCKETKPEQNG